MSNAERSRRSYRDQKEHINMLEASINMLLEQHRKLTDRINTLENSIPLLVQENYQLFERVVEMVQNYTSSDTDVDQGDWSCH